MGYIAREGRDLWLLVNKLCPQTTRPLTRSVCCHKFLAPCYSKSHQTFVCLHLRFRAPLHQHIVLQHIAMFSGEAKSKHLVYGMFIS